MVDIELEPLIWVTRTTTLKVLSGNLTMPYSEPCDWTFVLDNSEGDYGKNSDIAKVRDTDPEYLTLHIKTGPTGSESEWASPDLRVYWYNSGTDGTVTIRGRCRLAELDKEDQSVDVGDGISTAENMLAGDIIDMILAQYGLEATGVPERVIPLYHLVGNPLTWLEELLPDYVFRMGEGNQVVFSAYTSHGGDAPALTDEDDLEIVDFVRTDDVYNKATVERIVPKAGRTTLLHVQESFLTHPSPSTIQYNLDEPSRNFRFDIKKGYRGKLINVTLQDEATDPILTLPLYQPTYVGTTAVHSFLITYELNADAADKGPFKSNLEILITGFPLDVDPVPTEGYSETRFAGDGDKPWPEPFSLVVVPDATAAGLVADAKVEQGLRQGSLLDLETRIRADKIPTANGGVTVTDHKQGFSNFGAIVEAANLSFDFSSDTGTMALNCTFVEAYE